MPRIRTATLLLLCALLAPCRGVNFEPHQFGTNFPYRLASPPAGTNRLPLVVFLHGQGECGTNNESQIGHAVLQFVHASNFVARPCHVLAPQCPRTQFWRGATLDAVVRLVDHLTTTLPIDRSRIYLTGLSMGGYGTWDALARYPDRWAAAVPICGVGDPAAVAAMTNVPIWVFHGDSDDRVPVSASRQMVEHLRRARGNVHYTEYHGVGHDAWTPAYTTPALMVWLFSQRRPPRDASSSAR
jgi:predicted peptidase